MDMIKLFLDQLPDYPQVQAGLKMEQGDVVNIKSFPVPGLTLVDLREEDLNILGRNFQPVAKDIANKIFHHLYGPNYYKECLVNQLTIPKFYFKSRVPNNQVLVSNYGEKITIFSEMVSHVEPENVDRMIISSSQIVDAQHPYCETLVKINKEYAIETWPHVTTEICINEIRHGENILGQIPMCEVDISVLYYLEIDDISPFTAYQLTR